MITIRRDQIYLSNHLRREILEINRTLESLTAQKAYNSLTEKEREEYGPYSSSLDPASSLVDLD